MRQAKGFWPICIVETGFASTLNLQRKLHKTYINSFATICQVDDDIIKIE